MLNGLCENLCDIFQSHQVILTHTTLNKGLLITGQVLTSLLDFWSTSVTVIDQ